MQTSQLIQLLEAVSTLTSADFREILDIFGPCDASVDIRDSLWKARNLIVESKCQQCFDQTHTHQHD